MHPITTMMLISSIITGFSIICNALSTILLCGFKSLIRSYYSDTDESLCTCGHLHHVSDCKMTVVNPLIAQSKGHTEYGMDVITGYNTSSINPYRTCGCDKCMCEICIRRGKYSDNVVTIFIFFICVFISIDSTTVAYLSGLLIEKEYAYYASSIILIILLLVSMIIHWIQSIIFALKYKCM